MIYFKFKRK